MKVGWCGEEGGYLEGFVGDRSRPVELYRQIYNMTSFQHQALFISTSSNIYICKVSLTQGRYTWRHNQAPKSLDSILESKQITPISLSPQVINSVQATRSVSPPLERGQLYLACDWKMLINISKQMVSPLESFRC